MQTFKSESKSEFKRLVSPCVSLYLVLFLQLLVLCYSKIASMNTFFNDEISIFCFKCLKRFLFVSFFFFCVDNFSSYVYLLHVTNKCKQNWLILKGAIHICSLSSLFMPQILILTLRLINVYIKINTHIYQDL